MQVISGPPHTQIDELALSNDTRSEGKILPYQWSKSKFDDLPHMGHPDLWKFQAIRPAWVWE